MTLFGHSFRTIFLRVTSRPIEGFPDLEKKVANSTPRAQPASPGPFKSREKGLEFDPQGPFKSRGKGLEFNPEDLASQPKDPQT